MEQILQDVRYGIRTCIRQPGFAITAILALALGIGANTAVFSVVYAILLRPLPFAEPEQLIYAYDTFPAVPVASVSWPKFVALRDGNRTLSAMAAFAPGTVTLTGRGEPQQAIASRVSGDFFKVFGVGPLAGRTITPDDDVPNGGKVIVLSSGLWQRRFGGDPRVVGQGLTVDGETFTIAAVMPAAFNYPAGTEAWVPLALSPSSPGNNFLRLVGRMKRGTSIEQASEDLRAVSAGFNQANQLQRDVKVLGLQEYLVRTNRQMLLLMQGAVAFVLLVACANVANLLLARSVTRGRELSIRAAIGAGRFRLVRQLLTESLLLSIAGGIVGVLLASWLLRLFLRVAPANFAGVQTILIDRQVLLFTLIAAVVTGLIFGLAPARRGFQTDPNEGLRDTGARGATSAAQKGASRALVVVEIALAMILVVGAGLMVKSLLRLQAQEGGFQPGGVLTFTLNLPKARYATNERIVQTYDQVVEQIRSVPGVESAGAINMLPLVNFGYNTSFNIVGRPPFPQQDRAPILELRAVTPAYFEAMGIPLLKGRPFNASDTAKGQQVMIINATMAEKFWPNANPLGEKISFGSGAANENTIVGVVGDTRSATLATPPVPESFFPLTQFPINGMTIVVRSAAADPTTLLPPIRQRLAGLDPSLPLVRPRSMAAVVEASAGSSRLTSVLSSVFGALAGLLATVGIYSLIAYSVAQRTRELGIRVALGADRGAVLRLIVGEGLVLAAVGILIGLAGARLLTGTLQTFLYEVSPLDPVVVSLTCASVVLVTALASYLPARRAIRVDPMHALRAD